MPSDQTDDENTSELPHDILDKILDYLRNHTDKLLPILTFLNYHDNQSTERYLTVLRSVFTNDAFVHVQAFVGYP